MTAQAMEAVRERIRRLGPLPYDEVIDAALYGPGGFFADGGGAGRRADFLTSPEVGPLFGAVFGRFLDEEWDRLGRPDFFLVVEAGAGGGALAAAVLAGRPRCLKALRYVCVERSRALRDRIESSLAVEPATNVFGVLNQDDDLCHPPALHPARDAGSEGPVVTVLDDLPALCFSGVVFANELLDNLAFRLLECVGPASDAQASRSQASRSQASDVASRWAEVRVALSDDELTLVEVLVAASSDLESEARRLAPGASVGARLPLQLGSRTWLHRALSILERGRVVVIDYADHSSSLARRPWRDWLRTYRDHERGGHPLEDLGDQDITCEVAVDQLARVRAPDLDTAQAEWLSRHGIEVLVDQARVTWQERASIGDLRAMVARSRVSEAEALTDATGLGAFRVLEWIVE